MLVGLTSEQREELGLSDSFKHRYTKSGAGIFELSSDALAWEETLEGKTLVFMKAAVSVYILSYEIL